MQETPLVSPVNPRQPSPVQAPVKSSSVSRQMALYPLFIAIIIVGVLLGYFLSPSGKSRSDASATLASGDDIVNTSKEVGSTDTSTFGDSAQGTLEAGGFNGEGTHKLVRLGGASQTVYVVSSLVDLDEYVGKKVEIWGQTLKAKRVGWLMDVGRLKILE